MIELAISICLSTLIHFLSANLLKKKGKFAPWKLTPITVTATIALIGFYTIFTAPTEKFSNDAKQLQAELEANAALLEMQSQAKSSFDVHETALLPILSRLAQNQTVNTPTEAPPLPEQSENAAVTSESAKIIIETKTPPEITMTETPIEPAQEVPVQEELINNQSQESAEIEMNEQTQANASIYDSPVASQKSDGITVIGDSVMLGAVLQIEARIPGIVINAKISRQVRDAIGVLQQLDARGELGKTVVIALGSNGRFKEEEGQALLNYLGPNKTIYWVTAYGRYLGFQDEVNATIRKLAEKNSNVTVIDWVPTASEHDQWFWDDGMHLNPEGKEGYAEFIVHSIGY